jgi:hypothetical protein
MAVVVLFAAPALARPTLSNQDDRRYDFILECRASTEHGRVAAREFAPLSSGCTLSVKGAGSVRVHTDSRCVIRGRNLACT